jgi:hypothetical protein
MRVSNGKNLHTSAKQGWKAHCNGNRVFKYNLYNDFKIRMRLSITASRSRAKRLAFASSTTGSRIGRMCFQTSERL